MIRTVTLLSVMTALFLGIGFFLGGFLGMTMALVLAFVMNFVSYWYSDRIVLRIYRAHLTDDEGLNEMAEHLSREAGIPKPKIYIIPTEVPNAFATGRNPENSAIAVTRGLSRLSKGEMEAVMAHEMGHIQNRDVLIQTVAATIAGAIAYLAMIGYWSLFGSNRRDNSALIGIVFIVIFAPLAASIIKLAISRRREYAADHSAAIITRKPQNLASALRKISEMSAHNPMRGSSATSHMWIVNPFKDDWFTGLFSTHPPIKRRIAKLERMSGAEGE